MNSTPAASKRRGDRRARFGAEQLERTRLACDQRDADRMPAVRGHQRGLIQRQEPPRPRRRDERDAADLAGPDLLAQRPDLLRLDRAAELDDAVEGRDRPAPMGQDQAVVGQRVAAAQDDAAPLRVDRRHGARHEPDTEIVGDLAQRPALGCAAAEHLRHQHRPEHEVRLRGDERRPHAVAREVAQREHELERGDPASDDDDLWRRLGHERRLRTSTGRVSAPTCDSTCRPWT